MIITDQTQFQEFLKIQLSKKPKEVLISTYGYNDVIGVQSSFRKINNLKLLVGISPLRECVTGCVNCRIQYRTRMTNYGRMQNILKDKIRFRNKMHTKIFYFDFGNEELAILGNYNIYFAPVTSKREL